jgi:hypothetical protein
MAFIWILSHSEMETPSNPWTPSCKLNSLMKIVRLSQSLFTNVRVSCVLYGWHSSSQKPTCSEKSFSPSSNLIASLTDDTDAPPISTDPHRDQNIEMDPPIAKSSVLSTESTDAHLISTHSVQPVEMFLFSVRRGHYASLDLVIDALSSPW